MTHEYRMPEYIPGTGTHRAADPCKQTGIQADMDLHAIRKVLISINKDTVDHTGYFTDTL